MKKMKPILFTSLIILFLSSCNEPKTPVDNLYSFAKSHQEDFKVSVYVTAHSVNNHFSTEAGRREAVSLMRANGITKIYLEVYRSGLEVSADLLKLTKEYFEKNGFDVTGAIATVPGKDYGLRQEGPLGWFNWQNKKTQNDMKQVMINAAPIFDRFIIDDFLCTGDISDESKKAKGEKNWPDYRRELMANMASSVFIEPARSVNPDIHMIIKYPQWYDRFHLFGYDVESGPKMFDEVWVGTETRGQYTQRYGFVQPYEGFVNYRWISSLSGDKIGGAWFDHGDCDDLDFIEQAFQSVLAGATELVIFNYGSFIIGHKGHHKLRMEFENLSLLAKTIKNSPVIGVSAYKPPQSDAGGDLYIMDYIGMLGIPLIPESSYPKNAQTVFLPTQAATDPLIVSKVEASIKNGSRIIMTSGFLAQVKDDGILNRKAGILKPSIKPLSTEAIVIDGSIESLDRNLDLEAEIEIQDASKVLTAMVNNKPVPFLTSSKNEQIFVLNSHTFSDEDFKAVGEVLLSPKKLGLLDLPKDWIQIIRNVFNSNLKFDLQAPSRISMQPLENGDIILHNYNKENIEITLRSSNFNKTLVSVFEKHELSLVDKSITVPMKPRSRIWLRKNQ
jgi:hypothetical protein